jgi:asparagine synthase (glutamine-hydrolysing)
MCGITGFIGEGNEGNLRAMLLSIKHRGPDDEGILLRGNVGLAHARLSIIDLSASGHQPMLSDDQRVSIVFNGEIYNFKELRNELTKTGQYRFNGTSDTEVIIALYKEYGEKCFEKMNGMFAIAIYDFSRHALILARDRMGKKPLYWASFGDTILFGSELKALFEHPLCRKELNLCSLNKYLIYDYVPTPHSIMKNVHKLMPATYIVFENNSEQITAFWHADFTILHKPEIQVLGELDELLRESVESRLVADVPVGVFLSGGIDSSTIAYYSQLGRSEKIDTFSINFSEKSFNESEYAKKVAKILGTKHHATTLDSKMALDLIPRIGDILDEPLADASIIPTYFLSDFTRKKVTVALGGDGADELFAGYPTFQAEKLIKWYRLLPTIVKEKIIKNLFERINTSDKYMGFGFKVKKFLDGVDDPAMIRHQKWLGSFKRDQREGLFLPLIWDQLKNENEYEDILPYWKEASNADEVANILYQYMRTYLMDEVLVKVDRASMAHGLEVRSPFLDYHLVDFANHLPYSFKCNGFTTKYILKKLMEDKLPSDVVWRKKHGFGIPVAQWLRDDLRDWCNEVLSERIINKTGLWQYETVRRIKEEHFSNQKDNRKLLWNLIMFQVWYDRWM